MVELLSSPRNSINNMVGLVFLLQRRSYDRMYLKIECIGISGNIVAVLVVNSGLTVLGSHRLPGIYVHGLSQARILDGLPFLSPGDLPDSGIKSESPVLAGGFFTALLFSTFIIFSKV